MRALLERQVAAGEQVHRHVERLLRVVIALERVARRQVVVGLDQVDERLLHVRRGGRRASRSSPKPDTPSTLKTSTLWYATIARPLSEMIVGCGTFGLVAHRLQVVDDVVGVFLRACSSRSTRSWSASRRSRRRGRRRRPCT